ncbi:hypothetical protein BX666DRAFT_1961655 [Dichotomocladium elegans]|nr:hypothetical protein BX666DRAFT_1961655 [Dichotomocladium elegans]
MAIEQAEHKRREASYTKARSRTHPAHNLAHTQPSALKWYTQPHTISFPCPHKYYKHAEAMTQTLQSSPPE